jgi:hypothetical protein
MPAPPKIVLEHRLIRNGEAAILLADDGRWGNALEVPGTGVLNKICTARSPPWRCAPRPVTGSPSAAGTP